MPTEQVISMRLRPTESVSCVKELISTLSGIQSQTYACSTKINQYVIQFPLVPSPVMQILLLCYQYWAVQHHVTCAIMNQGNILVLIVVKFIAKTVQQKYINIHNVSIILQNLYQNLMQPLNQMTYQQTHI